MWDAPDYAGALAKLGFDIERQEDLSQHVAPTYAWVRRELERRRPEFEGRIGKDLVDRTSAASQFWVGSAAARRIGRGVLVARTSGRDKQRGHRPRQLTHAPVWAQ